MNRKMFDEGSKSNIEMPHHSVGILFIRYPCYLSNIQTEIQMQNQNALANREWRFICTALMFFSLGAVIYGTLPLTLFSNESNEFGFSHAFYLIVWIYGLTGIVLFHLENAAFRRMIMIGAVVWSTISALGSTILNISGEAYGIRTNYPFAPDGNILFIMLCIFIGVILSLHSRKQYSTSEKSPLLPKIINRVIIAIWAISVLPLLKFV